MDNAHIRENEKLAPFPLPFDSPPVFQIWDGKLTEQVEDATTHEEEENAETEETAMSRHLLALLCHVEDNHCNFHDNVGRTYLRVSFHSICQSRITPPSLSSIFTFASSLISVHHKRPTDYTNTSSKSVPLHWGCYYESTGWMSVWAGSEYRPGKRICSACDPD